MSSSQRPAVSDRAAGLRPAACGLRLADGGLGSRADVSAGSIRKPKTENRNRHSLRAFTLVEIAVVFAVIAILAAVVTYAAKGWRTGAKVKQAHALMSSLKNALDEFKGIRGSYPPPPKYVQRIVGGNKYFATCPPAHYGQPADYYRNDDDSAHPDVDAPPADAPPTSGLYPRPIGGIWAVEVQNDPAKVPPPFRSRGQKLYGIQGLHYFLMSEPGSRQVLSKLESSLKRADQIKWPSGTLPWPANTSNYAAFQGATRPIEVMAILDPWGVPLYYGQSDKVNNGQPFLQSAGPDSIFDNGDDIFSFKGE